MVDGSEFSQHALHPRQRARATRGAEVVEFAVETVVAELRCRHRRVPAELLDVPLAERLEALVGRDGSAGDQRLQRAEQRERKQLEQQRRTMDGGHAGDSGLAFVAAGRPEGGLRNCPCILRRWPPWPRGAPGTARRGIGYAACTHAHTWFRFPKPRMSDQRLALLRNADFTRYVTARFLGSLAVQMQTVAV